MSFSVLIEFFAVVDDFFDGFEVSNGPSHPSVQLSSTRILVLHIENLFLKLQTLRFILFRVLNYSRPCLVISFEIVCGIFLIFNFISFVQIKYCHPPHFTLDFGTESEGEFGLKVGVSVPDSLFLHLPALSCINFLIFHNCMNC